MKKYENGYLVEPEELEALEKGESVKLEGESHPIDTGMTLYEINQQLVKQMPVLTRAAAENTIYAKFRNWINTNQAHFYIFICREGGEYTVFYNRTGNAKPGKFWDELWEVFNRLGIVYSIQPDPEGMEHCVEVWAAENKEAQPQVYYLLNWDEGTIEL